ncbi:quercetin dioxygenase-like cupin family protein [Mycobacteroides chelonae]|nr:quercetin dioxygenase-like cupin family protein [Mycobacteroides chelonae]
MRNDLQRHDLSTPGREVLSTRVDFQPGAQAARHKHPGEEIIYVLKGTLVCDIDGQGSKTVTAGAILFVPAETFHSVRNVGDDEGSELATYVVDKDKPLVVLDKSGTIRSPGWGRRAAGQSRRRFGAARPSLGRRCPSCHACRLRLQRCCVA